MDRSRDTPEMSNVCCLPGKAGGPPLLGLNDWTTMRLEPQVATLGEKEELQMTAWEHRKGPVGLELLLETRVICSATS
jgi:hypothetical protein